jgi:PIN domain nuclease of toxin-antitoxin system
VSILDAMALVAALTGEPARDEVERLLRDRADPPRIAAANLAEVADVLVRIKAFASDQVLQAVSWLRAGGLDVTPTDDVIALAAGELHARHYHHRRCPVSLCDCLALATAALLRERLATADPALAVVARTEAIGLVPLPDSSGRRP